MKNNCVSIVIPVYNHEKALFKALDSIFEQTYLNWEVIIVDDGSKELIKLPERFKNKSIQLIRQNNLGAPAARNTGLKLANGEYIIFWDADVIAKPKFISEMVNVLEKKKNIDFVYTNMLFGSKKMPAKPHSKNLLEKINYIHSTSLIRKNIAIKWDKDLKRFQDWDYWLRLTKQGKKGYWIDKYLFKVIPKKGGMSEWLPAFAYKKPYSYLPWWSKKVKKYNKAKDILYKKHNL